MLDDSCVDMTERLRQAIAKCESIHGPARRFSRAECTTPLFLELWIRSGNKLSRLRYLKDRGLLACAEDFERLMDEDRGEP